MADNQNAIGPDKALSSLADYTRWLTGLATAGLAFAVGIQQNLGDYDSVPRLLLVWAWGLLAFSALAGILLQSSFPTLYRDKKYSINDPWLIGTYWAALGALIIGSVLLFLCFFVRVKTETSADALKVRTAAEAASIATCVAPCNKCIRAIGKIDLIKGADESDLADRTWRVQLLTGAAPKQPRDATIDVLVNAIDKKYGVVSSGTSSGRLVMAETPKACE